MLHRLVCSYQSVICMMQPYLYLLSENFLIGGKRQIHVEHHGRRNVREHRSKSRRGKLVLPDQQSLQTHKDELVARNVPFGVKANATVNTPNRVNALKILGIKGVGSG